MVVVVVVTTVVCVAGAYENCPRLSSDLVSSGSIKDICTLRFSVAAGVANAFFPVVGLDAEGKGKLGFPRGVGVEDKVFTGDLE